LPDAPVGGVQPLGQTELDDFFLFNSACAADAFAANAFSASAFAANAFAANPFAVDAFASSIFVDSNFALSPYFNVDSPVGFAKPSLHFLLNHLYTVNVKLTATNNIIKLTKILPKIIIYISIYKLY
jgi:hypothetical protein